VTLAAVTFWSGFLQAEFGRGAYIFMAGIAAVGLVCAGSAALALRGSHSPAAPTGP
jgi:hypothetical protein